MSAPNPAPSARDEAADVVNAMATAPARKSKAQPGDLRCTIAQDVSMVALARAVCAFGRIPKPTRRIRRLASLSISGMTCSSRS